VYSVVDSNFRLQRGIIGEGGKEYKLWDTRPGF